jgi:putative component of toxin-antitoxin plasmid stabilization module
METKRGGVLIEHHRFIRIDHHFSFCMQFYGSAKTMRSKSFLSRMIHRIDMGNSGDVLL